MVTKQKESRICRGKKCIMDHIGKHKKKYLIGSGILAGGIGLVKIITIAAMIFGLSYRRSSADQTLGEEEKMLLIFYQIEEIAHQRENTIERLGYEMPQREEFHKLEKAFHTTQDLYEKYEIAKKLDIIIHTQDAYLDEINYTDSPGDEKFHDLENEFDDIQ